MFNHKHLSIISTAKLVMTPSTLFCQVSRGYGYYPVALALACAATVTVTATYKASCYTVTACIEKLLVCADCAASWAASTK